MTNHIKPSNKVLADRLKRDEWGQKMYRPNGGEFVTSHKHGVVGEAYDEMLDGLNYLYRAQSERALAARSLVHLAADLLAAEIMELEALGTTIDERNRMELTADTETGKDQRIAALKAQLAEANERCAGLAAALADFPFPNELTNPDTATNSLPICVQWRSHRFFQWADARKGEIAAAQQILAAVREEARREGAVKELKMLHIELSRANFREIHDILSGDDLDSIRRLVSNRIAALEAEG